MNTQNIKKYAFGLAVAAVITVTGLPAVQAQSAPRRAGRGQVQQQNQQQRNNGGQVDSNGNIDRNQNGIDDRYETRDGRVDINQNGVADQVENNGSYGNNGRNRNGAYSNGNYGYNNGEVQKGYRDGLNRGQQDARSRRSATPYNSDHFRNGNAAYREGFTRGYNEGYRQNGRRW